MNDRITIQGESVFIELIHTGGKGKVGLLLRWNEAIDFAEHLVKCANKAKKRATEDITAIRKVKK